MQFSTLQILPPRRFLQNYQVDQMRVREWPQFVKGPKMPKSALGISGCLFTSQVGTGHHCLYWQLHTPFLLAIRWRDRTRFPSYTYLQQLARTVTWNHLKRWNASTCDVEFILIPSSSIHLWGSKFAPQKPCICCSPYAGNSSWCLHLPPTRQEDKAWPHVPLKSLGFDRKHFNVCQNQIQVWTLPIHDSSSGVWNEINVYSGGATTETVGDSSYEVDASPNHRHSSCTPCDLFSPPFGDEFLWIGLYTQFHGRSFVSHQMVTIWSHSTHKIHPRRLT